MIPIVLTANEALKLGPLNDIDFDRYWIMSNIADEGLGGLHEWTLHFCDVDTDINELKGWLESLGYTLFDESGERVSIRW